MVLKWEGPKPYMYASSSDMSSGSCCDVSVMQVVLFVLCMKHQVMATKGHTHGPKWVGL